MTPIEERSEGKGRFNVRFIDESDPFGLSGGKDKFTPVAHMTYNAWVSHLAARRIYAYRSRSHVVVVGSCWT